MSVAVVQEKSQEEFMFIQHAKIHMPCQQKGKDNLDGRRHLIAVSSLYGFIVVVVTNKIYVYSVPDIEKNPPKSPRKSLPSESDNIISIIDLHGDLVYHIALSADHLTLAACLNRPSSGNFALLFDTRHFYADNNGCSPFASIRLSDSAEPNISHMLWNPGESFVDLIASCSAEGTISLWSVSADGDVNQRASEKKNVSCACWSPKGKQIVAVVSGGQLVQLDQNLNIKKTIAPPPGITNCAYFFGHDISWLTTASFIVAYSFGPSSEEADTSLFVITTQREKPTIYQKLGDVCFGHSDVGRRQFYFEHISQWNMIIVSSANAIEAAVLGRNPADPNEWVLWSLSDDSRAEIPTDENYDDCFPTGMGIATCTQQSISTGQAKTYPPAPLLFILSTDCVLTAFSMINQLPEATTLVHPASTLPKTGLRKSRPDLLQVPAQSMARSTTPPALVPAANLGIGNKGFPLTSTPRLPVTTQQPQTTPVSASIDPSSNAKAPVPSEAQPNKPAVSVAPSQAATAAFARYAALARPVVSSAVASMPSSVSTAPVSTGLSATTDLALVPQSQPQGNLKEKTPPAEHRSAVYGNQTDVQRTELEKRLHQICSEAINQEIKEFDSEIAALSSKLMGLPKVGDSVEANAIRDKTSNLQLFVESATETIQSHNTELNEDLKSLCLDGFAAAEELRFNSDNKKVHEEHFLQRAKQRPLDPLTERRKKDIEVDLRRLEQRLCDLQQNIAEHTSDVLLSHSQRSQKQVPEISYAYRIISNNYQLILSQQDKLRRLERSTSALPGFLFVSSNVSGTTKKQPKVHRSKRAMGMGQSPLASNQSRYQFKGTIGLTKEQSRLFKERVSSQPVVTVSSSLEPQKKGLSVKDLSPVRRLQAKLSEARTKPSQQLITKPVPKPHLVHSQVKPGAQSAFSNPPRSVPLSKPMSSHLIVTPPAPRAVPASKTLSSVSTPSLPMQSAIQRVSPPKTTPLLSATLASVKDDGLNTPSLLKNLLKQTELSGSQNASSGSAFFLPATTTRTPGVGLASTKAEPDIESSATLSSLKNDSLPTTSTTIPVTTTGVAGSSGFLSASNAGRPFSFGPTSSFDDLAKSAAGSTPTATVSAAKSDTPAVPISLPTTTAQFGFFLPKSTAAPVAVTTASAATPSGLPSSGFGSLFSQPALSVSSLSAAPVSGASSTSAFSFTDPTASTPATTTAVLSKSSTTTSTVSSMGTLFGSTTAPNFRSIFGQSSVSSSTLTSSVALTSTTFSFAAPASSTSNLPLTSSVASSSSAPSVFSFTPVTPAEASKPVSTSAPAPSGAFSFTPVATSTSTIMTASSSAFSFTPSAAVSTIASSLSSATAAPIASGAATGLFSFTASTTTTASAFSFSSSSAFVSTAPAVTTIQSSSTEAGLFTTGCFGLGGQPKKESASVNPFGFSFTTQPTTSTTATTSALGFGSPLQQGSFQGSTAGVSSSTLSAGFGTSNTTGGVGASGFGGFSQTSPSSGFGQPASFGASASFGSPPAAPAFGATPAFGSPPAFGGGSTGFGTSSVFGGGAGSSAFGSSFGTAMSSASTTTTACSAPAGGGFGRFVQQSDGLSFGALAGTPSGGGGSFGFGSGSTFGGGFGSPSSGGSSGFTQHRG